MLEHPWMVEMRSKRVNMAKYLSQVWGWDEQEAPKASS
jgi:mitogen-activated protein kinase kinase